jgi:hypothetical protein
MMTQDELVELLRREQSHLASEFGVKRMGVFGSYARDQADAKSDVDLVVEFERPIGFRFFDLIDYLEQLLGRKVDLLTPVGIQTIRRERVAKSITESIVYV